MFQIPKNLTLKHYIIAIREINSTLVYTYVGIMLLLQLRKSLSKFKSFNYSINLLNCSCY